MYTSQGKLFTIHSNQNPFIIQVFGYMIFIGLFQKRTSLEKHNFEKGHVAKKSNNNVILIRIPCFGPQALNTHLLSDTVSIFLVNKTSLCDDMVSKF